MDIRELLEEEVKKTNTNTILSKKFINSQVISDLADILTIALEDEDEVDGVSNIFIPRAYLTIIQQNEAVELLLDLFKKDVQESILKKIELEQPADNDFVGRMLFEKVAAGASTVPSSGMEGYREVISVKIFLTGGSQANIMLGNENITIDDGDVVVFQNNPLIPFQAIAGDQDLHIVNLTIKTRLVDATVVHHSADSEVGVIIDCKDMESPTKIKDLEYGLANITRLNLVNRGFSNIVCFFGRGDFDQAVSTLRDRGVKKVLVIFAGAVVDETTYEKVLTADHITAWKSDEAVLRKYVVFDTDKYEYFQIRGHYLSNVLDQVNSVSHKDFGLSSLQPDEKTYEFLELIYRGLVPQDISLLKEAGSSEGDLVEGAGILKEIKEILLNT